MSLSQSKLEDGLRRIFTSPDQFASRAQAEDAWVRAVDAYWRDATDLSGDAVASVNVDAFGSALSFRSNLTAEAFCRQIDAGFTGYWTGATFNIGKLVPGIGTPECPNAPTPSPPITGIFAVETSSTVISVAPNVMFGAVLPVLRSFSRVTTAEQKAREMSVAIHRATRLAVRVLISGTDTTPPSSGGPFPVTNTCAIF